MADMSQAFSPLPSIATPGFLSSRLSRCSKSCRLRWTNYLRPGIKRGNFTAQEEKLIFHLQALLGNRWAAIASYLPERTDNDIKNYWNTHLKKKLRKLDGEPEGGIDGFSNHQPIAKGQWEKRLQTDINMAKQALQEALSMERPSFLYEAKPTQGTHCSGSQPHRLPPTRRARRTYRGCLRNWVRKSPKSAEITRRSAESSSSVGMAASGTNNSGCNMVSPETSLFQGRASRA
ncbi:hypothetical protein HPP92_011354 [Vanilla planifolia]|uniref:Uncharacterized protein n=1 Tax=Vanilla planifolia TaxID=51239 RepID=A0A835R0E7_VANPL|nr:hypothetical protein HPP92_011354 [Vanilla planifolia]